MFPCSAVHLVPFLASALSIPMEAPAEAGEDTAAGKG